MLWSNDLKKRLIELNAQNLTQPQIAAKLSHELSVPFTRDQIKNALARTRFAQLSDSPRTVLMPYYDKYEAEISGSKVIPKDIETKEKMERAVKLKVLVLSDIHVPFTDEAKLQQAINMNRTADLVILAGDTMDGYSCSRHRKKMSVPHEVELDNTVRLLEYLSSTFPWVKIIRGNHDERALKKIRDMVPSDLLYLFDAEPLDLLVRPFRNVEYISDWWIQVGDAIIAHQERSSIVDGKPGIFLMEYFLHKGWAERLGLTPRPKVFVTGHTHQLSSMYREGVKVFESGSLTKIQDYVLEAQAFMRPPQNGFVSLTQYNGHTDFNESREFIL